MHMQGAIQSPSPPNMLGDGCVGVVDTVGSTLSRETHSGIHIKAGLEVGVASTRVHHPQAQLLVIADPML